jgi:hypothetical protein
MDLSLAIYHILGHLQSKSQAQSPLEALVAFAPIFPRRMTAQVERRSSPCVYSVGLRAKQVALRKCLIRVGLTTLTRCLRP